MTGIEAITLFLQGVVPMALIGWIALRPRPSMLWWGTSVGLAASYLWFVYLAGLWLALPRNAVFVMAGLLALAAGFSARRPRVPEPRMPHGGGRLWLGLRTTLMVVFVAGSVFALSGQRPIGGDAIDLAFPMRGGPYLVVSGGSNRLVNFHLETLTLERARPFRGQSFATDIVKLGPWGSRLSQLSPDDPEGFAIFGEPVHSPCPGEVVIAVDGQPDGPIGIEPQTLPGNHVILDCSGTWVVLAHMMNGSVRPRQGDEVTTGERLGSAGNSGASGEPHLHVHAQRPGTEVAPLGGDPLPVTFDGRHLVRNDKIRLPEPVGEET